MNRTHRLAMLAAVALTTASTPTLSEGTRPYLTAESASAGVDACTALARERGWPVAVAVLDRGGHLVVFERMDDAFATPVAFSQIKAETAASTSLPTVVVGELVYAESSPLRGLEDVPGITGIEGGEPIALESGYVIGGVGVSGATPAQDGECARAAAAAIVRRLEGGA